jgi:hypothetical protein
MLTTAATTHR